MEEPTCSQHFSELNMLERDLEFEDIFRDLCPNRFNEFGLKREMRFISERIIVEYDPNDTLSVREIMHPMDPFRTHEPYFRHNLADKSKNEYVTSIDFHEHITYFPYAKNTGDICLARYISNFNDTNFTKISGQGLCSLPGETIYSLRVGRLDKGMLAVNHRAQKSRNTTVTVVDLVKPARDIVYYDAALPINTIDWLWHGPFYLAIGDDISLRIADVRCPKNFNSVFFDNGVKKTAITSTRPLEIACWDGKNILLYDIRRPEVPCAIHPIDLKPGEEILDLKFNPYLTNELFIHTSTFRVIAIEINPARLVGGRATTTDLYDKWEIMTFKHIDRGCTSTRHAELRREKMPYENLEIPLRNYCDQYEASKLDQELTIPFTWRMPSDVDLSIFDKLKDLSEYDFEGYLSKAVDRVAAEHEYVPVKPPVIYETFGVESFDFVFPGINGIMCFDREKFTYRIETSPRHYEGCLNPDAGSDSVFYYRGIQIQEMIPAQTLTMMCERLQDGWNAYQTSEGSLIDLAFKITERNESVWANWLRNSAIIQYSENEFTTVGEDGLSWKQLVTLPNHPFPKLDVPPFDTPNEMIAATEISEMLAPFFRMFVPEPIPDPESNVLKPKAKFQAAIPKDSYSEGEEVDETMKLPEELSVNMRTLCKCHAKIRYYNSKQKQRAYMYNANAKGFFIASSARIREKFFRIGWSTATKEQILDHRVKIDSKLNRYQVFDDLKKFNRLKPREFQKRVLPPKMITDSTNILMKPEYIKEREEKEREMREKASQPLPAPIGMTMTKPRKDQSASRTNSMLSMDSADDDPERARFLIRAALQLADNDDDFSSTNNSTPVASNTRNTSAASTPIPSAHSTISSRENDDFEYETAEDAFFGIKKKRMYVVYQPATKPLGLLRYKPDRLGEHTFVRRLERLVYHGTHKLEKRILKANFEEDDKRLSSIKERYSLDLKKALNCFMRLGWQTFYDKNFFFSEKIPYNEILRKVFEVYNSMCFDKKIEAPKLFSHQRMIVGMSSKAIMDSETIQEAVQLSSSADLHVWNPTITGYNRFMNFLSEEMPYQAGLWPLVSSLKYYPEDVDFDAEFSLMTETPTAMYDRRDDYMFPTGRLRFCEFEIPPEMMQKIRDRRKIIPAKKHKCLYLEDLENNPVDLSKFHMQRTKSCPDLCLEYTSTQDKEYDENVYTDGLRKYMAENFKRSYLKKNQDDVDRETFSEEQIRKSVIFGSPVKLEGFFSKSPSLHNILANSTKFVEWDSPMIVDINANSGERISRRVVPFPEPEHPRQIDMGEKKFGDIPLETRQFSTNSLAVAWIINMPTITTFPGVQILDEGRDQMFTLCCHVPRTPDKRYIRRIGKPFVMYSDFEEMNRRLNSAELQLSDYTDFVMTQYETEKEYPAVRIPVFEVKSVENIPTSMIEMMKPGFYGMFEPETENRYQWQELAEMRGRREIQQKIMERRFIVFRQPLHEETKTDVEKEEMNVEEDDLKTSSDEDKGKDVSKKISGGTEKKEPIEEPDELQGIMRRKVGVSESENLVPTNVEDEDAETAHTGSPKKVIPPKEPRNVSWGKNTEHDITERDEHNRPVNIPDVQLLRQILGMQLRRDRPLAEQKNWAPVRKYSDPMVVYKSVQRRRSLDQYFADPPTGCTDCYDEPWPSKEVCIKCFPKTSVHACTNIENMRIPCDRCKAPLFKFSCANYAKNTDWLNRHSYELGYRDSNPIDEDLRMKYASKVTSVEEEVVEAPWVTTNYNSGDHTVEMLLQSADEKDFRNRQANLLTGFYSREFHHITWHMDDAKSENIFESEQFALAFDRDADVDMMRDTMNTISQDGEMDMMTTYDQRTGKRVRRWISYSALATRVQKQNEKVTRRKRAAEREEKILAGEISVEPDILERAKRKALEKEIALKAEEAEQKATEEKNRREFKTWEKKEVPKFIEDPKRVQPVVKPPKTEDWLESSGSEDELPPIKARMLSNEIKDFITTIKKHISEKPDTYDGLRVVYGKQFEPRPLLKNDVVLVNKKRKMKRKPPQFRIQRIPLDESWLNNVIKVQVMPPPNVAMNPKDSHKWTVPFYSSKQKQLTSREKRKRAFRPPTPPPTLKREYTLMKDKERAFYREKARKEFEAMKKAKVARFMRYRGKLVSSKNIGSTRRVDRSIKKWQKKFKAWTKTYQRAMKSRRRYLTTTRRQNKYTYRNFIFTHATKKSSRHSKLVSQAILPSSISSNHCPVIVLPAHATRPIKVLKLTKDISFVEDEFSAANPTGIVKTRTRSSKVEQPKDTIAPTISKVEDGSHLLNRPRGRSVPRQVGCSGRPRVAATRCFSVDCDRRMKKVLKRLVQETRRDRRAIRLKIPSFKPRDGKPVETANALSLVARKTKPAATAEPISVLSMQNRETKWEKKFKKLGSSAMKQQRAKVDILYGRRRRPLLPRWLPTGHETDMDNNSSSMYQYQHMRSKRYTKTRTPLALSPTRSRVLNTVRKLKAIEQRNCDMMYEPPIPPKIADLHLHPWNPLKISNMRRMMRRMEDEYDYATMSWRQMLKKLTNYRVKVNRVLLKDMRKYRRKWEKPDTNEETTVEILITPTPNLKSCMKGPTRRTLKIPPTLEKKDPEFGSSRFLTKTPTELRLDTPSPPKSVKTVPSLLKYNFDDDDSSRSSTPLSIDTTDSIPEVHSKPNSPLVEAETKRADSPLILTIGDEVIKKPPPPPSPAPAPLMLLKPVDSPLVSADTLPPKEDEEKKPAAEVTPPRKLPADQQWRLAMMARRNMGSNRQLGRPTIPPAPQVTADTPSSARNSQSPTSPNPDKAGENKDVFDQSVTVSEITAKKVGPPKSPGPTDTGAKKKQTPPPLSLSEEMMGKRNKPQEAPPKSPKAPSPPKKSPAPRYPGELEPLENIVYPIPEDHVIDLDPDPQDTRRRIHPRTSRKTPPKPGDSKQNGNDDQTKKKSFLGRFFSGSSKKSPSESSAASTSSTSAAAPPPATTPAPNADEPLLPRIKKPESGQLVRRHEKLTMWVPNSQITAPIAKIVDGKPVYAMTTRPRPLARKKPEPPPQPPSSSSSSSSDEDDPFKKLSGVDDADYPPPIVTSAETSKAEQKAFNEASQVIIPNTREMVRKAERDPEPVVKPTAELKPIIVDSESPSASSVSPGPKSSSGKTVTFGPTYAFGASLKEAYGLLDKPVPDEAVAGTSAPDSAQSSPKKTIVKKEPLPESKTVEQKVDKAAEKKVEKKAEKKVEKTIEKKIDKVVEKKVDKAVEKKDEKTAVKPVEKPTERKTEKPVEKKVEKKLEKKVETKEQKKEKLNASTSADKKVETSQKQPELEKKKEDEREASGVQVISPSTVPTSIPAPVPVPVPPPVPPPVVVAPPQEPPKTRKRSFFSGFSPFGKITPKSQQPQPQTQTSSEPSSSNQSTPSTGSSNQPSTSATPTDAKERPTRKTSTRRQLKMGDPSPLALSGDASLPKPAEQSPERPPHLDIPEDVVDYKSPSQRKYYTRLGQESAAPSTTIPVKIDVKPSENDQPEKKKRRVRKPAPVEEPIIFDEMERFSQLTEENLKLFDRQHDIEYIEQSPSIAGFFGDAAPLAYIDSEELSKLYSELRNAPVGLNEEKMAINVEFELYPENSVLVKPPPVRRRRPKYQPASQKLKRMMRNRKRRLKKLLSTAPSFQDSAIQAVRKARNVRFIQSHGKKWTPVMSSDFKPKSILKDPTPPVTWWYRIDSAGNKRYLKSFGPSETQLKLEKQAEKSIQSQQSPPKKPVSYLQCWAHVMKQIGEQKVKEALGKDVIEEAEMEKEVSPADVDVDMSVAHPPSRSLSWVTVSSSSSLTSLLDALEEEGAEPVESNLTDADERKKEDEKKKKPEAEVESQPEQQPLVFFGMTITRSPSTSTSEVPETVQSTAEDGSQIVEYVGQEEPVSETTKRRFDPFVRPLSALFKAFTSTEVGTEAGSRSRRSRLGGFFRRNTENAERRPASSSPTRRQADRDPEAPVSQNSSAEDILALIGNEPNALEKMEEEERRRIMFPPLQLPDIIPPSEPMFAVREMLEESLYTQFVTAKEKSRMRKMNMYLDNLCNGDSTLSDMQRLISFDMDRFLRISNYPRPSVNFGLLGQYPMSSLKINAKTRKESSRASDMIVRKLNGCRERLERTKESLKSKQQFRNATDSMLTAAAMETLKKVSNRKPKKIRVQYKFKKTCVKYRVAVTIPEKSRKLLRGDHLRDPNEPIPPLCAIPKIITTYVDSTNKDLVKTVQDENIISDNESVQNYDGDIDGDDENQMERYENNVSKQLHDRRDQRKELLKHYFQFSVRMARKVARRSLGAKKPLIFYAFINQIKSRMRQFMDLRREKHEKMQKMYKKKSVCARNEVKKLATRKRTQKNLSRPFNVREALKFGNTVPKQVIVEHSKFTLLKRNARVESFFEYLDEYIDVGTPIKLIFRSKNTILPNKAFDPKTKMFDSDIENSPSCGDTDSDFSSDTPEDPNLVEKRKFFDRKSMESTYHVKGLPGLIYLAKLVEAKVGDELERNIPFFGPGLDRNHLLVYMSPIRRLMLNSLGLRMPDRLDGIKLRRNPNDNFGLWFGRLFRMICYGRGDACEYIIEMLSTGIGLHRKKYDKMDLSYQARVIYKLYKKMMFIESGKEGKRGINELILRGIDMEEIDPIAAPIFVEEYDRYLDNDNDAWSREDWTAASDSFLSKSEKNPDVLVTCRACVYAIRMVFLGGYSQDVVDDIIPLKLPIRDKLLFIINLTPPEHLVENIIKMFNTVRGLDRLPFVGLGYHADPLQVLFDEAKESGDPQLIAHIIRVGRCLDRRSQEKMVIDYNSDQIKNRDFGQIMVDVFTNGKERLLRGAPTMDEMFPYRYVRHDDGTHVKKSTEQLANVMECEVTRYMAILELTKGAAVTKGDLEDNPKFNRRPTKFMWDVLCTGCKFSVAQGRNLGSLGRTLCVSTMPLIEQDKDKKRWPSAKTMSPKLTFENYIETLDPTENKMLMAKDVEEEKTDITVQILPSRFGCYYCRFSLPRCSVCMCAYLNDHMDFSLKEKNERYSQFSVCNICNHGGHVNHIAEWFATEKFCPVAGCDCRCLRTKRTRNLKGRLRRHMLLSANMRAKSHLCNPECALDLEEDDDFVEPKFHFE